MALKVPSACIIFRRQLTKTCRKLVKSLQQQQQQQQQIDQQRRTFQTASTQCPVTANDIVQPTSSTESVCPFTGHRVLSKRTFNKPEALQKASPFVETSSVRKFEDVPSPKGLPIVGTTFDLLARGGAGHLHEYCDSRHKQLGPIYREKLGSTDCLFIANSEMIQKVYQNEGRFPNHMVPEAWTLYNEINGIQRGLFFMNGPEWEERRKGLNKVFLCPSVISQYSESFNQVVTDLLSNWDSLVGDADSDPGQPIKSSSKVGLLTQLERDLYSWSIESLGTMIFGRRLGCVDSSNSHSPWTPRKAEGIHDFVNCVQQLFVESAKMNLIPARLAQRLNLPVWRRFVKAADQSLHLARTYVEENVRMMKENGNKFHGDQPRGVLHMLLKQPNIDQAEVIRIIIDLFLAAADTTSHATQWALYLLSKHPEYQEKILNEVGSVVGKNGSVQEDHLKHFPYVTGVIKEALRLYPVAPFLSRRLSQDIVLGRHHIPAGVLIVMSIYTTGRDNMYFDDAVSFKPERWIRNRNSTETREVINTHASLPFGLGVRSCVGRRVAEVQMRFLLSRVIQKFHLEPGCEEDIGIKLRMITTPERPIHLRLRKRT